MPVLALVAAVAVLSTLPPGAAAREARLMVHVGPQSRAFIIREARREIEQSDVSESAARSAAEAEAGVLGADMPADIDLLVQLVMSEVNRQAEDDLRDQMQAMQTATQKKAAKRAEIAAQKQAEQAADDKLSAEYARVKAQGRMAPSASLADYLASRRLQPPGPPVVPRTGIMTRPSSADNMSAARVQTLTDQRKKAIETLSNLMKKAAETREGVTDNLK